MNENEVNKTIAIFMGNEGIENVYSLTEPDKENVFILKNTIKFHYLNCPIRNDYYTADFYKQNYTQSLDALIPVVEKLTKGVDINHSLFSIFYLNPEELWSVRIKTDDFAFIDNKSPSLALATACANVIKELNNANSN